MKALDLEGQVFGELTAVSPSTINKKRGWNCKCSCGKTKWIPTFQLTSGHNRTCGDGLHKQSIKVGDRFGNLEVMGVFRDAKNRRYRATVFCDCGVGKEVSFRNLQRGTTHCGCKRVYANNKLPKGEAALNSLIGMYRGNAKTKGIAFSLTKEECIKYFKDNCHYCGKPPNKVFKKKNLNGGYTYSSIDRIDSTLGYTPTNTVSCCTECNYLKNNTSYFDFLDHIKRIYEHIFKD